NATVARASLERRLFTDHSSPRARQTLGQDIPGRSRQQSRSPPSQPKNIGRVQFSENQPTPSSLRRSGAGDFHSSGYSPLSTSPFAAGPSRDISGSGSFIDDIKRKYGGR